MKEISSNALVRLALVRPISVWMIFLSILVLGAVAFANIPLELFPKGMSMPRMIVMSPYPDGTAQDTEDKITRPIEEAIATLPGVKGVFSTSSTTRSMVSLEFESGTNMDQAYLALRDRIARIRPDLPDDLRQVNIQQFSTDDFPIAVYGVSWAPGLLNPKDRVNRFLIPKLERIAGVGMVQAMGNQDRQIQIELDRERAEAANLNIFALAQTLGRSHFSLASGRVREASGRSLLRSVAEYQSAQELRSVVVGANGLRLSDVATVSYSFPEREKMERYRGRELISLLIFKESGANTTEISKALKKLFKEAQSDPDLAGFSYESYYSEAKQIELGLSQVFDSGLQGGVLALVVLGIFLRRFRLTLVIACSIPLSMFMALPFMYFSGQSINMFSLLGLMICIGLVVDNAVVISENIARHRSEGMSRALASLQGASEVALPITLATATTMVVFLPSAVMSAGTVQMMMIQMVTPICVSLLASLFIALLLMPMASLSLLSESFYDGWKHYALGRFALRIRSGALRVLDFIYEHTVLRLGRLYLVILSKSLKSRMDVAMVGLFALMSLSVPFHPEHGVKQSLNEEFGNREIQLGYTIPSDVTLEEVDSFVRRLESWFTEHRAEYGINGEFIQIQREYVPISVYMLPPKDGDPPRSKIAQKLLEVVPCPVGWELSGRQASSQRNGGAQAQVFIYGETHDKVQAAKDALLPQLLEVDGVAGKLNKGRDTRRRNELALKVNSAFAQRVGVQAQSVGATLAYALRGSRLPSLSSSRGEIEVWIRYDKKDREQLQDLVQFRVPTDAGSTIAIDALTQTRRARADAVLTRRDRRVTAVIELKLDAEDPMATKARIAEFLQGYASPPGTWISDSDEAQDVQEQQQAMLFGMVLGAVLIFLIMGFLFESFVLPLSVLPAIPLAFVGVGWTLFVFGANIDPLVIIALMLLMGVVVNNAIVLIDFVNAARSEGMSRNEAILKAAKQRFRPILMTSLTTIGGMIPLAFASGASEGINYGGFGKALVGGLASSTLLTLFVVPWAYTLLDDLRFKVMSWIRRYVAS